jgi:hypothetical protein
MGQVGRFSMGLEDRSSLEGHLSKDRMGRFSMGQVGRSSSEDRLWMGQVDRSSSEDRLWMGRVDRSSSEDRLWMGQLGHFSWEGLLSKDRVDRLSLVEHDVPEILVPLPLHLRTLHRNADIHYPFP